eukprot:scaffold276648_cov24-Tisochrysis_lutea.AAC.1
MVRFPSPAFIAHARSRALPAKRTAAAPRAAGVIEVFLDGVFITPDPSACRPPEIGCLPAEGK